MLSSEKTLETTPNCIEKAPYSEYELIKHSASIHISNYLSHTERKISNILLLNAFNELNKKEIHKISLSSIIGFLGLESTKNLDFIKESFKRLNSTQIEWNVLNKDKKNKWGVTTIISSADIENGICSYSFSPTMRKLLATPNIYARLNLLVQSKFTSKHSLALWEFLLDDLCTKKINSTRTERIHTNALQKIFGVEYVEFKEFNRSVLKKAINEINDLSDLNVSANLHKTANKVSKISFDVSKKENYEYSLPNIIEINKASEPSKFMLPGYEVSNENSTDTDIEELKKTLRNEMGVAQQAIEKLTTLYTAIDIQKAVQYVNNKKLTSVIENVPAYFFTVLKEKFFTDVKVDDKVLNNTKYEVANKEFINTCKDKELQTALVNLSKRLDHYSFNNIFIEGFVDYELKNKECILYFNCQLRCENAKLKFARDIEASFKDAFNVDFVSYEEFETLISSNSTNKSGPHKLNQNFIEDCDDRQLKALFFKIKQDMKEKDFYYWCVQRFVRYQINKETQTCALHFKQGFQNDRIKWQMFAIGLEAQVKNLFGVIAVTFEEDK